MLQINILLPDLCRITKTFHVVEARKVFGINSEPPNGLANLFGVRIMVRCLYCQKTKPNWKLGASCDLPIIVAEHPTQLLLTSDASYLREKLRRFNEFVTDPLVIAPVAMVTNIERNGCSKVVFAQRNMRRLKHSCYIERTKRSE
jgi:hypothetical protein